MAPFRISWIIELLEIPAGQQSTHQVYIIVFRDYRPIRPMNGELGHIVEGQIIAPILTINLLPPVVRLIAKSLQVLTRQVSVPQVLP